MVEAHPPRGCEGARRTKRRGKRPQVSWQVLLRRSQPARTIRTRRLKCRLRQDLPVSRERGARSSHVWTQPGARRGGGRGRVPPPPSPGPPGVTHPEHRGVNDERELEPEVGEARAVAHLLRVPAGHPGRAGRGARGSRLGPWQRAAPPAAASRAARPAPPPALARGLTPASRNHSPARGQPQRPMGARHRPSLWEGAG